MHLDLNHTGASNIETDVCIVGAGVAYLALAISSFPMSAVWAFQLLRTASAAAGS